jgi:hypothetical protein
LHLPYGIRSSFLGNRRRTKIFVVNENVCIACCGRSEDGNQAQNELQSFLQLKADLLTRCRYHSIQHGRELGVVEVSNVARKLICQKYKNIHLVIAGCKASQHRLDEDVEEPVKDSGRQVSQSMNEGDYKIFEILPGGAVFETPICVCASSPSQTAAAQSLIEELSKDMTSLDSEQSSATRQFMGISSGLKLVKRVLGISTMQQSYIGSNKEKLYPIDLFVLQNRRLKRIDPKFVSIL